MTILFSEGGQPFTTVEWLARFMRPVSTVSTYACAAHRTRVTEFTKARARPRHCGRKPKHVSHTDDGLRVGPWYRSVFQPYLSITSLESRGKYPRIFKVRLERDIIVVRRRRENLTIPKAVSISTTGAIYLPRGLWIDLYAETVSFASYSYRL